MFKNSDFRNTHNSGCKINTAHFADMMTRNDMCPMVLELSSSVPCKTAAPVLPIVKPLTQFILTYRSEARTKSMEETSTLRIF